MRLKIKELNMKEAKKMSPDLIYFNPEKCLTCGNKKRIVQRFFLLNVQAKEKFDKQIKKGLKDNFGLTYYGFNEKRQKVITTAKCPQCDGEKMWWD